MCRKGCGVSAPLAEIDELTAQGIQKIFGSYALMVRRDIPGGNHFEEIARLRQDRKELDDLADDYMERNAAITAEIRLLAKEDQEQQREKGITWLGWQAR